MHIKTFVGFEAITPCKNIDKSSFFIIKNRFMIQFVNCQPVFELFSSVYLLEPSQSAALSLAVRALQFYKFRPNRMIFRKNRDNNFPLVHHNILL